MRRAGAGFASARAMLTWLKKALSGVPDRPPLPDHEIFAVGDIHGRVDLLRPLLEKVRAAATTARPDLIFLGDYIDRGPGSREVVDQLLDDGLRDRFQTVFLKGNHEATLLEFLKDPGVGPSWIQFGGGETLMSYGVRPPEFKGDEAGWADASRELRLRMPRSHKAFYEGLQLSVERGCYLFVHAGVDPSKPLEMQDESDLLWVREAFMEDTRALSRIIVHGHTPEAEPHHDHRRIGLDLGGYQTGRLASVRLHGADVSFITT